MSNPTPRWRRRRYLILAVLLLVIGGPIAWRLRPLTSAERQLVGTWGRQMPGEQTFVTMTFRPDRTYTELLVMLRDLDRSVATYPGYTGSWNCSSGTMSQRQDRRGAWVWSWKAIGQRLLETWKGEPLPQTYEVEFDSDDHIRIVHRQSGFKSEFERIADPTLLEWAAEPKVRKNGEAPAPALLQGMFRQIGPPAPVVDQGGALDPVAE